MKLCVFQGTFNPIHNAHLAIANYTADTYEYDTVLFIPAYKPPHKEIDDEMANHRFQMVKLAVSGESIFGISNIEFQNERYSYTYYTIEELYKRYKIEDRIGFIIGYDAFREITEWFEADKLQKLVHFIVFPRDEELNKERLALLRDKGYKFSITNMKPINISSTMIRERLVQKEPVGTLLPHMVLEYINKNELYKDE